MTDDDLTDRLRSLAGDLGRGACRDDGREIAAEAAGELTRLRSEVDRLKAEARTAGGPAAIMVIPEDAACRYDGCTDRATHVACGQRYDWLTASPGHPGPDVYCEKHAEIVAGEDVPDRRAVCPNCRCTLGVG